MMKPSGNNIFRAPTALLAVATALRRRVCHPGTATERRGYSRKRLSMRQGGDYQPPYVSPAAGLLCAAVMLVACAARGDDALPQPAAPKRYDALASHSPFAPPTGPAPVAAATPTPPPGPSWSDNLVVTSLMQDGNVYTATVMEKDTSARSLVRSDVANADNQLQLASVSWADKPEAIRVTVRKGTQTGDVRFDAAGSAPSGGMPAPPSRVSLPSSNFHPPPGVPNPPVGQPLPPNVVRGRPVIRANPPSIPGASRPVVTAPNPGVRAPGKAADDDDDDDN